MLENVKHDEHTMGKVYQVLVSSGFTNSEAAGVVSKFQNAGILFRERDNNPEVEGVIDLDLKGKELSEAIGIAAGALTACWDNLSGAGVFEGARASDIVAQLEHRIYAEISDDNEAKSDGGPELTEWIEKQEEERRAWAVSTVIELFKSADVWNSDKLIPMAGDIEAFVKGPETEDPDLHDQDAFDTWGVVMTEQIAETLYGNSVSDLTDQERNYIETKLDDTSDKLTKAGVRFKNGEKFERLIDPQP